VSSRISIGDVVIVEADSVSLISLAC
jgi:hypothetical protein